MIWLEGHWFDVMLWAMWFSVTLGTGLLLYVRERKQERSFHDPWTCKVCAQFRHDQYVESFKSSKERLHLVK